jgi:hypothetical protein
MTKTYVITSGKHHTPEKVYIKGDKIELTEQETVGLTNKIIDPEATYGVSVESDNSRLLARIAELELENEELKEAIESED